ncbi:hypothetical protein C4544_02825 [candidate division WS5 bacterium]|uniref:Uncharacterized protein n=1 Tax=candidate division WS5 bacterium TaxID=2093353 RepID=A0A419DE91_9BACT|nr:MAG: hypothetical protein C4544_02825 [candidate division WS5 bacterium]
MGVLYVIFLVGAALFCFLAGVFPGCAVIGFSRNSEYKLASISFLAFSILWGLAFLAVHSVYARAFT